MRGACLPEGGPRRWCPAFGVPARRSLARAISARFQEKRGAQKRAPRAICTGRAELVIFTGVKNHNAEVGVKLEAVEGL